MKLNQKYKFGDEECEIVEFLKEPDTGLCRVAMRGLQFVIPCTILAEIERLRKLSCDAESCLRRPIVLKIEDAQEEKQ